MEGTKRTISLLLALCMALSIIGMQTALVSAAGEAGIYEIAAFDSEAKKDALATSTRASITTENTRMFDKTLKMTIYAYDETSTANSKFIADDFTPVNLSEGSRAYNYINYWIYNPKATDGTINLFLMVNSATSGGYAYYFLPASWEGWNLVSIPLEDFTLNITDSMTSTWDADYSFYRIGVNGWEAYDGCEVWTEASYILVDQIYFSAEEPVETGISVASTSIQNGAENVQATLDGTNTYTVTMSDEIGSARGAAVTVKKDGAAFTGGYSVSVDENDRTKLNVTFDDALTGGAAYEIIVDGYVYDKYGYETADTSDVSFTVAQGEVAYEALNVHVISKFVNLNQVNSCKGTYGMTDENARLFNQTLKLSVSVGEEAWIRSLPMNYVIDTDKYKYLNFWIYSPQATAQNLEPRFYKSGNTWGSGVFWQKTNIDFEGWKLVSIPLSDFKASNSSVISWSDPMNNFKIMANSNWTEAGYVLLDEVYLSDKLPSQNLAVRESSYADGVLSVSMNRELLSDTVHTDSIAVKKDGEAVTGFTAAIDGNDSSKLNITLTDAKAGEYTVTLKNGAAYDLYGYSLSSDYTAEFSVAAAASDSLAAVSNGDGTVCAEAVIAAAEEQSYMLLLAQYSADGTLLAVDKTETNAAAGEAVTLKTGNIGAADGAYKIKAMLWNTMDGMKPYTAPSEAIISASAD